MLVTLVMLVAQIMLVGLALISGDKKTLRDKEKSIALVVLNCKSMLWFCMLYPSSNTNLTFELAN